MSLYLKSPSDIQALIDGPDYVSIDTPTKTKIALHFEEMPASVREATLAVLIGALPNDQATFAQALFTDVPPTGGGSGTIISPATGTGDYTFRRDITALTGGGIHALDAVNISGLATGVMLGFVVNGLEAHYQLRPSNGNGFGDVPFYAQLNDPTVIKPVGFSDRVWVQTA